MTTVGHRSCTVDRNRNSAAVSSCEASLTNNTACDWGSVLSAAAFWIEPSPPTPGVSTSIKPDDNKGRSIPTVTDRSRRQLPGLPASEA